MQVLSASSLPNGLKVEITELPHLHSATVSLAIGCGSRHESPGQWGLSHLLEHMLFRGSARYPTAQDLALAFERAGGTLEAETWRDHTYLSVTTHPSRVGEVLLALADMVIKPRFDDLDIERQIVESELQAELDERGRDIDMDNISRAQVWGEHPMGRRIVGSMKSLKAFTCQDVATRHTQFYGAQNAVLSVAGRVERSAIAATIADCFGCMAPGTPAPSTMGATFNPKNRMFVRCQPGSQLSLQITFAALPDTHPDFLAQTLLSNILDDGMTSRLQQAVCEQQGLVYSLTTGLDCYSDCGLYDIDMAVAPKRAAAAVGATLDTLRTLLEDGVTEDELSIARERSLHALEFQADSPVELAQARGIGRLFGMPYDPAAQALRLRDIGSTDIARVARHLFATRAPHLTLIGPTQRADLARIERSIAGFAT